ncbi:MAG TPA: cyclase family protein [Amycolatopsis sp.]|jgi:kynurenine formamidase
MGQEEASVPSELPSNWGRWGEDDERGTLNLITDEVRARAAAEVRTGQSVSLAQPIEPVTLLGGPFSPETTDGSPVFQMLSHTGTAQVSADLMLVTNHHPRSTHLDALSHQTFEGKAYPGRPMAECVTPVGVRFGSTAGFASGIVTRGVLLDLAVDGPLPTDHVVSPQDLEAAEEREGVHLESGDALVIRGGRLLRLNQPIPGLSVDSVRWMHARGVSLYVGDIGDAHPPQVPGAPSPLHTVALARMGMPLLDAAQVEDLAVLCAELGRYSFLLSVAPPRILGLTGVPVNPIAIF